MKVDKKKTNSTIYEIIMRQKVRDEKDPIIQNYISEARKECKDDIQRFELWIEYLKRNRTFKSICQWFEEARNQYPYPPSLKECQHKIGYIEDYLVFAANYSELRSASPLVPLKKNLWFVQRMRDGVEIFREMLKETFFVWAVNSGFPKEYRTEALMNLFVFGNVFKDPKQITLLRILFIIETRNKLYVYKLEDIIDTIFKHIETDPFFLGNREVSIEEYKHQLKRFLGSDFFLNISLLDPYENKYKTLEAIKDLIDKRRSNQSSINKEHNDFFKPDQFEWPTGNIHVDELKRYLQTYDLKQKGYKNREIASKTFKGLDPNDEHTKSRVKRDNRYAKRILKNVDDGFFPGKYS